jgi:hypothetical protein
MKWLGYDWRKTTIKDATSDFSDPHGVNRQIAALDRGTRSRPLRRTDNDEPEASASASAEPEEEDDEGEVIVGGEEVVDERRRERLHRILDNMMHEAERDLARRSIATDAGKCGHACEIRSGRISRRMRVFTSPRIRELQAEAARIGRSYIFEASGGLR